MPSETSETNATTGLAVQLSASSVTTVISAAGTSSMHSTEIGAGLEAVGSMSSLTENVELAVPIFPQASTAVNVTIIGWLQFPVGES